MEIKGLNIKELQEQLELPAFRARQIFKWIHLKHVDGFDQMTDLPKDLRDELKVKSKNSKVKIIKSQKAKDRTIKYLLELEDGEKIETVHMKDAICVSSQAGCALDCQFCATGKMGFKRNLTVSEILSQVYISDEKKNVVFMGMGEPFLNYDNVMKSVRILNDECGMGIGARKMTISTCGIPEGIRRLGDEDIQVRLAVSLNSANDKIRTDIMPINRKYPLKVLHGAISDYQKKSGRRVTLEYVMLKGINDSDEALRDLIGFCRGLDAHVNLIPYNEHKGVFQKASEEAMNMFARSLKRNRIEAVIRISRGADIRAACGQLANSV